MFWGFGLLVAALILIVSGYKNVSFADVLKGDLTSGASSFPNLLNSSNQSSNTDDSLLHSLAEAGRTQFGLTIREYAPYDKVDPVHVPGSLHYQGRAFDASGSVANMSAFANWLKDNYGSQLTELFWGGMKPVGIKNGKPINNIPAGHTNHVHVGI